MTIFPEAVQKPVVVDREVSFQRIIEADVSVPFPNSRTRNVVFPACLGPLTKQPERTSKPFSMLGEVTGDIHMTILKLNFKFVNN